MVPGQSLLLGNDELLMNNADHELVRWDVLLLLSEVPCFLSLITLVFILLLDSERTVSFKIFDTQVLSVSTEELVLLHHARYALSRLRGNRHSILLNPYF